MAIISEKDLAHLKTTFGEKLTNEVRLVFFTQETECPLCSQTHELVQELSATSDKIKLEVYDFAKDEGKVKEEEFPGISKILLQNTVSRKRVVGIRKQTLFRGKSNRLNTFLPLRQNTRISIRGFDSYLLNVAGQIQMKR